VDGISSSFFNEDFGIAVWRPAGKYLFAVHLKENLLFGTCRGHPKTVKTKNYVRATYADVDWAMLSRYSPPSPPSRRIQTHATLYRDLDMMQRHKGKDTELEVEAV
jgi:hypothetical protein